MVTVSSGSAPEPGRSATSTLWLDGRRRSGTRLRCPTPRPGTACEPGDLATRSRPRCRGQIGSPLSVAASTVGIAGPLFMAELRRSEVSALRWADCPPRGQTHGLPPYPDPNAPAAAAGPRLDEACGQQVRVRPAGRRGRGPSPGLAARTPDRVPGWVPGRKGAPRRQGSSVAGPARSWPQTSLPSSPPPLGRGRALPRPWSPSLRGAVPRVSFLSVMICHRVVVCP